MTTEEHQARIEVVLKLKLHVSALVLVAADAALMEGQHQTLGDANLPGPGEARPVFVVPQDPFLLADGGVLQKAPAPAAVLCFRAVWNRPEGRPRPDCEDASDTELSSASSLDCADAAGLHHRQKLTDANAPPELSNKSTVKILCNSNKGGPKGKRKADLQGPAKPANERALLMVLGTPRERWDGGGGGGGMASGAARPTPLSASDTSAGRPSSTPRTLEANPREQAVSPASLSVGFTFTSINVLLSPDRESCKTGPR
ncbi:MAG: hypothetical protein FRX49_01846 [Trebouxia sp. A1-2]|nr:MAG: hypothetical protein FRX49_01846 [Trebouxia sp. A1-2]